MQNPMMQNLSLNKVMQALTPVKNMMSLVKYAGNPQMMMQQMMAQNPQMKQAMDYVNQNGGDAKEAFYKLANENGVNPEDIINYLKV